MKSLEVKVHDHEIEVCHMSSRFGRSWHKTILECSRNWHNTLITLVGGFMN
jgi:hypothetical protein